MDDSDPPWDTDPLWYDRTESGAPPGPILEALAWLFLLVPVTGIVAAIALPQYQSYVERAAEYQEQ